MREIDTKINDLIDNMIQYKGSISYRNYVQLLSEQALDIYNCIEENKNNDEEMQEEYYVLGKLISRLLNNRRESTRCSKKLKSLYEQLEEVLANIPKIEPQEVEITDINSLIKSLKIYKLSGTNLSQDTYQSSYQLYSDLRKIILNRNSTLTAKVYTGRIVDKLSSVTSIDIKQEDYELFCIMRLVKENPDFGYGFPIPVNRQQQIDILTRFDHHERKNHLLELKKVAKD